MNNQATRAQILTLFPHASEAVLAMASDSKPHNPATQQGRQHASAPKNDHPQPKRGAAKPQGKPRARTKRNFTEAEFELMLEHRRRKGEIRDYVFQGITLAIGDGARYTTDFLVINPDESMTIIETKGMFVREAALVRFRTAKERYKRQFTFEMWQRKRGGGWEKIL